MKKTLFCIFAIVIGILVCANGASAKNHKHMSLKQLNVRYDDAQSKLNTTQQLITVSLEEHCGEEMDIQQLEQYELRLKTEMRVLEKKIEYRKIQDKINQEARKQRPNAKKIVELAQKRDEKVREIYTLVATAKPDKKIQPRAEKNTVAKTATPADSIPITALADEPSKEDNNSNNDINRTGTEDSLSFNECAHPNGIPPVLTVRDNAQASGQSAPAQPKGCTSVCSVVINSLKNPILHLGYGVVNFNGTALHVAGGGPIFVQPLHSKFILTEFLAVGRVWGHGLNLAYAQYGGGPGVVLKGTVINPAFGATRINLPDRSISSKASFFLNILHGPLLAQYVYVPATHTHIAKLNAAVNLSSILKIFK